MAEVRHLYRVDIGFDPDRGYAALVSDVGRGQEQIRHKGIRGNSVEQIMSRLRHTIIDEEGRRKHFPLESEQGPPLIITPNDF